MDKSKKKVKVVKASKEKYNPEVILDNEGNNIKEAMKLYRQMADSPEGTTSYRQNISYRGMLFDKFGALENDFSTTKMDIRLAQTVYRRFGFVRHAIDTMAEFTVGDIDFESKNKTAREVMEGWSNGVGMKAFLDQVALEYYRSGNVYIYRFESKVKDEAIRNLTQMFGLKINASVMIPTKYTLIDPNLINFVSSGLFDNRIYQIVIPASEVKQMVQQFKNNPSALKELPEEFATAIERYLGANNGRTGDLLVQLNPQNIIVIHRKKQPYEPYATPFLAGAFDDLEFRQELRNMDKALSRVIAKILIHVAVGDSEHIPSPEALRAISNKLSNPSNSTYLVTDGAVKITQFYPDIAMMLDPKKYEAVQKDINSALGISAAAFGDGAGSYSNNFLGIKILIERIIDGRTKIQDTFLVPECKRVAKLFNLKSEVNPVIIGSDLTDEKEWALVYARLFEDGVLSAQGVIDSIKNGRLPTFNEELENQADSIEYQNEGFFVPVANRGGNSQNAGRPQGAKGPAQSAPKKASPNGGKATVIRAFTTQEHDICFEEASSFFKEKLKIKKISAKQSDFIKHACNEFLVSNAFSKEQLHSFLTRLTNS